MILENDTYNMVRETQIQHSIILLQTGPDEHTLCLQAHRT